MSEAVSSKTEMLPVGSLKPHPRNYRTHPEDQLEHIRESIRKNGIYRNIVIARDNTILAGHGVVKAAESMGIEVVPVIRLDISPDSAAALKVLTGDNEISRLSEVDERALLRVLNAVKDDDLKGLLGTGYDDKMLAAFSMVMRPDSEIQSMDAREHWVGMPGFEDQDRRIKVMMTFDREEDREAFLKRVGVKVLRRGNTPSAWWPSREKGDWASLRYEAEGVGEEGGSDEE